MTFFTFENIKRGYQNLYNLFTKTVVNNTPVQLYDHYVTKDQEMRLDKISDYFYNSTKYVEELMKINNIICPYSIKEGDLIKYFIDKDADLFHIQELETNTITPNKNKATVIDKNRTPVAPTTKPKELKGLIYNEQNRILKINNNLQ